MLLIVIPATAHHANASSHTAMPLTGSFHCENGLNDTYGNGTCIDIDECLNRSACNASFHCQNTRGSFECHCQKGFVPDGDSCIDFDECSRRNICGENYFCKNTQGKVIQQYKLNALRFRVRKSFSK